jgi:hypothetical protein
MGQNIEGRRTMNLPRKRRAGVAKYRIPRLSRQIMLCNQVILNCYSFTFLYRPAQDQALTSRNIKAEWMKAGLFPFIPNRVLRDIQRRLDKLSVPKAYEANVGFSLEDSRGSNIIS